MQLVEVAFVSTFRQLGLPLQRIRRTREYAARMFQAEYPFAELRFKTEGNHLLLDLQHVEADSAVPQVIVADAHGQVAWEHLVSDRFMQFDYEDDIAIIWHVRGREAPITIDPRVAFGAPLVKSIPTWVIKGRWKAGERFSDIESDFGLKDNDIVQALAFEGINVEQDAA